MKKANERRRRYFCDSKVQGALLRQLLCYWVFGVVTLVIIAMIYQVGPLLVTDQPNMAQEIWRQLAPTLLVTIAVAPIVFTSAVRFSNRFVGPMLRFRRALDELARGETPTPIDLREKDYWGDVADSINAISEKLARSQPPAAPSDVASEESVAV